MLLGVAAFTCKAQEQPKLGSFKSYNSGQAFTCISVDDSSNIWAGTNKAGLFRLNKITGLENGQFSLNSSGSTISNYVIQSLAVDKLGNLWVGQAGNGTTGSGGGGVEQINWNTQTLVKHYAADRNAKGFSFLERDGLATNNVKNITVDINNTVWTAHRYHDLTSGSDYILTPGAMSYKPTNSEKFITKGGYDTRGDYPEWPYPAYTHNGPISQSPQSRTCYSIASDSNEVWISVAAYTFDVSVTSLIPIFGNLPARILTYSLDGTFKGVINFETIGIPPGGVFNAIYLSPKRDAWVSVSAGKGFAVRRNGNWTYFSPSNLPCLMPEGTFVNENAIWGNKYGNVFIGTNNGLIVYNGRGPVNLSSSYTIYNSATNPDMVSNNIKAGYSERDSIQWIATDNGILRTVIGRYSTTDPERTDYKSCKNKEMDYVEDLLKSSTIKRDKSYHIYKVESDICDITKDKGCTAENIYKMMKDDVTFAAITPYDFPLDDLTLPFLKAITTNDLIAMQKKINSWQASSTTESNATSGEIKTIESVIDNPALKELLKSQGVAFRIGQAASLGYFGSIIPREVVMARQKAVNPTKLESCSTKYLLFNSPNFIQSKHVFRFGNSDWIGRFLMNCDVDGQINPAFDPIYSYANDREYTTTNYTAKGHMLYPGKITRQVVEECGKVKMVTIGEGVQFCGDNSAGKANANGNVVGGCILFKNVDFRLIKKFKTLN